MLELTVLPAALIGTLIFVLGITVGSFLNVVILRLPKMMERDWHEQCRELLEVEASSHVDEKLGLAFPASHCPHCHHKITWYENIPLLSYAVLRGRCSNCRTRISARYPLIELLTGLLSLIVWWQMGTTMQTAGLLACTWALIGLAIIDYDTQLLPDDITLPLLWTGLLINSFSLFTDLHSALWGAVLGYASLWSVFWLFKLITGKEGMGYGDFKLLAALGAWGGWSILPLTIMLSSLAGSIIGGLAILRGKQTRSQPIPFGPFIALGGWVSLLWGSDISAWYLNVSGMN